MKVCVNNFVYGGDVDGGPTKAFLIDNKDIHKVKYFFDRSVGKTSSGGIVQF